MSSVIPEEALKILSVLAPVTIDKEDAKRVAEDITGLSLSDFGNSSRFCIGESYRYDLYLSVLGAGKKASGIRLGKLAFVENAYRELSHYYKNKKGMFDYLALDSVEFTLYQLEEMKRVIVNLLDTESFEHLRSVAQRGGLVRYLGVSDYGYADGMKYSTFLSLLIDGMIQKKESVSLFLSLVYEGKAKKAYDRLISYGIATSVDFEAISREDGVRYAVESVDIVLRDCKTSR